MENTLETILDSCNKDKNIDLGVNVEHRKVAHDMVAPYGNKPLSYIFIYL